MIRAARALPASPDILLPLAGAALTTAAAFVATVVGPPLVVLFLFVIVAFVGVVVAFVRVPHVAVAVTIPLFAALPTIKALYLPWAGPVKDGVAVAAVAAACVVTIRRNIRRERHPVDRWVLGAVALLMALYFFNPGGGLSAQGYDFAWSQGVRLAYEPLLLLLVGFTLDGARRTYGWAVASLIVSGCLIGIYGIAQQALGHAKLVELGYEYTLQVRFYAGFLRSFGTLDDPFAYAAFLLFAMAAVVTWHRLSATIVLSGLVLSAGLVVAYVRTAGIIGAALLGIWLAQRNRIGAAVALLLSAVVASVVILFSTGGASESRTYAGDNGYLTLNGRTEAWEVAIGDTPAQVLFGQGVGQLGRAAERARFTLSGELEESASGKVEAVDSGYFATVSDVGFVGLVVMLVIYGRLFALAASAARARVREGWVAMALLAVLMLDATTRDSFAGFPTAFVGLLLVGITLAAARERILEGDSNAATA